MMITKQNVHHNVIVVCMEKHYNIINIIYVVLRCHNQNEQFLKKITKFKFESSISNAMELGSVYDLVHCRYEKTSDVCS